MNAHNLNYSIILHGCSKDDFFRGNLGIYKRDFTCEQKPGLLGCIQGFALSGLLFAHVHIFSSTKHTFLYFLRKLIANS